MPNNKRSVMLSDDTLIDVLKFSDRFDIGERFEFVNANWSKCIARVEAAHLPLFKFHKIWICPLFCALHYSMRPTEDTILKEIFEDCSEQCRDQFMPLISDDWPAQRIPLCIYLERTRSAARQKRTQLKKITLNHNNWRVERNENGHFFMHFQQLCFEEAYLDVYNDRALTLFLLDCPIFQLLTGHFSIRTVTESLPFQRVVEFCMTKVQLTGWPMGKGRSRVQKQQLMRMVEEGQGKMENLPSASEMQQNPIFTFALTGGANCSELTLESNEFAMLFDLIEEYKYAPHLSLAIPSVRLAVPPYNWHQRDFVEDTICQMFDTSESISATLHRFSYFDALSAFAKFICNVHFHEEDPDKIKYYELNTILSYEFCAPSSNQQLQLEIEHQEEGKEIEVKHMY